ncbi:hypothetical protein [Variovorax sp. Sphag1AA]|uniref:hypothetical protein n=1 Tax=Variovorax sp. Sphag1AA TaxID=2587027 RepID=UPI00161E26C3|nr:hypothetical protein [Variovorax sp. Sphag1AA]MBB3180502.1 hypothetical protein [Variovorax sp. Sphag1AA]
MPLNVVFYAWWLRSPSPRHRSSRDREACVGLMQEADGLFCGASLLTGPISDPATLNEFERRRGRDMAEPEIKVEDAIGTRN